MRYFLALVLVMLVACQQVPLQDNPDTGPPIFENPDDARPDIPRTYPEDPPETVPPPEQPPGTVFIPENPEVPSVTLDVPLTDLIGEHHPFLTNREFPLLKNSGIWVDRNYLLGYKETLLFDTEENSTGRIIFTKDDTDEIGTFLFFEEDKTIFEYKLHLNELTFQEIQGRDIQILGHTYVISEASNTTVIMFGRNVESNLRFSDGEKLSSGSSKQQNTLVHVGPDYFTFKVMADDPDDGGILLSPGESLSENIGQNTLASQLLDIRYLGAQLPESSQMRFNKVKHGYRLSYTTVDGRSMDLDLVEDDAGKIILGTLDEPLRVSECPSHQEYCIAEGTELLLQTRDDENYLLRYTSASNESRSIWFRDQQGNRYQYEFLGEPGRNAQADVLIGGDIFRAEIGPEDNETEEHNISLDQGFNYEDSVEIVTYGEIILRFKEITDDTVAMELVVPRHLTESRKEEVTSINLTYDGSWSVSVAGNFTLEEDDDDEFGLTPYGIALWLDKEDENLPSGTGIELDLILPTENSYGSVKLEG